MGDRINPELLSAVDGHLHKLSVSVTTLSDLCGLVATENQKLRSLISVDSDYLVIGCHLRPMNLLFDQIKDGIGITQAHRHINLIDLPEDQAILQINEFCGDYEGTATYSEIREESGWPSWYPVIDYSRCTDCGQCADFCLFGVYEKTGTRINVINPKACKNNCPACARICPATAIIFPKYKNGGAIGGSDEIDEKAEQQRQTHDIENFLGNDIYMSLQKRKLRRKSIIREEAMKKAVSERDSALNGN